MIYRDFVSKFAKISGRTHVESKEICNQMLHIIMETIKSGESLNVYGFGILEPYQTQPRRYVIPSTGAYAYSDGGIRVRFKPGERFLKILNGEMEDFDDDDE